MENSVDTKHSNVRALKVYMSVYLCRNFSNKMWLSCENKKKYKYLQLKMLNVAFYARKCAHYKRKSYLL